jgi:polyphosphate kinase
MQQDKLIASLDNPAYYNNRELSWLSFNKRVLQEAEDQSNPLLEALRFTSIFSSNLDEFFMVRVAGLKDQVAAGFNEPENKAGLTPKEQLQEIAKYNHELVDEQYAIYKDLVEQLKTEDIHIHSLIELGEERLQLLEAYFDEQIFPALTPMAISAYQHFPMLANRSLNLAVTLTDPLKPNATKHAIVQVPALLQRFISIGQNRFVLLEEVISHYIYKLFLGYDVKSITMFRITRNADLEIHEEDAEDLLKEIENELRKRKWGAAVRLEVQDGAYDRQVVAFLLHALDIHHKDLYLVDGPLDLTYLSDFAEEVQKSHEHLSYEPLTPQEPRDIHEGETVFEAALQRDVFLHHPYESFDPVVELVASAAEDPSVFAIKQTLYRVSGNSPIIQSLKLAAENGKQVTVLVELKARFDEEQNVQWAKQLEKAGCHVIYGIPTLKTHSKITLIVQHRDKTLERFVHLGTGNYNDSTAKLYTDMGLITTNQKIGEDATNFFNYLSGLTKKPKLHHLSMAPDDIQKDFIVLIDKEIESHQKNGNGYMAFKMNSLTDKSLIKKLYEASLAGVKIDLIVRGICCLRPEIEGVSENITVRSIVGRYLEHSRIYYFHQNGEELVFLSSADMMTRNMERRVELLFPILDPQVKSRVTEVLDVSFRDNLKARMQDAHANYHYVERKPEDEAISSQIELFKDAYRHANHT